LSILPVGGPRFWRAATRARGRGFRFVAVLAALLVTVVVAADCSGAASGSAPPDQRAAAAAAPTPVDPHATPPVITTADGRVSGLRTGQLDRYHGIPFAAPPVGALRWSAPWPPAPWQGVRDGTRTGPACAQTGPLALLSSEDCLYLSVARPGGAPLTGRLPVILYIHGGAFVGGTGETFDPTGLVTGGPAIVVTTNYRLGPLGSLALPSMGGDAGDFALEDLIAALRWTRSNAAAFGGDPSNVTIMGESAGSVNVCALLAAPSASGLFERAIMDSGPCTWKLPTLAQASQSSLALAAKVGCPDPATAQACLRTRSASELMTAGADDTEIFNSFTYAPATGGATLPLSPAQALWNGRLAHVPLLMGSIRDEGRPFTNHWAAYGPITDFGVDGLIRDHFPDRVDRVLAAYPAGQIPPRERLARIITDDMFSCQTSRFAQLTAGVTQQPTYVYEFDVPDAPPVSPEFGPGATHGWDLDYLFPSTPSGQLTTPARRALSRAMIGYWTRFAATGDPSGSGSDPSWPRLTVGAVHGGTDRMLLTPAKIAPVSGTWSAHHCDIWS
jgi:para-nitrobenzyl esterase